MADTLGTRITTTMRQWMAPYAVDTILNSNVLFTRVVKKAKKWTGNQMQYPVKVSKNSTGTSFSGFDTFSTAATDNRVKLQFDPSFQQITSSLPLDEVWVNESSTGAERILNLLNLTLQSDAQDMADDLGTQWYGTGTGNSSKDFLGLGALCDDGTTVPTIGGLARSTYTTLKSTVTASSGTLTLAKMATLWNNVTSGSVKPTVAVTDEATFSLYEQLLQSQERYLKDGDVTGPIANGTGSLKLAYKGIQVVMDEKCTSGYLYFLNENFLMFAGVNGKTGAKPLDMSGDLIEGNDYSSAELKSLGFSYTDWIIPTNAAAIIAHIYFGGQFMTNDPKRLGVLTGITSV